MAVNQLLTVAAVKRKQIGLTQLDLAKELKLTQAEISWLENGNVIRKMDEIAQRLSVDVEDLLKPYEEWIVNRATAPAV